MRQLQQDGLRGVLVVLLSAFGVFQCALAAGPESESVRAAPRAAQSPEGAQAGQQPSAVNDVIDGFILIVDCSKTMAASEFKSKAQWAASLILDAAPDGIPMSVLLFGHHPAAPKNLVEVVGDLRAVPLNWRAKANYRSAIHVAVPSNDRVFLSGPLNVARDIVESTTLERVAIVVITDGQNAGDKFELAINECVETAGILTFT
jgi:hypothetical protein